MKGRFWKRLLAVIMALLIMMGAVPIQPISDFFTETTMADWGVDHNTQYSPINIDGTDYTLFTRFYGLDGPMPMSIHSDIMFPDYDLDRMIDGNLKTVLQIRDYSDYITFWTKEPIIPKGYILNTGYPRYDTPSSWVLYGMSTPVGEWTVLDSYQGDHPIDTDEFRHPCNNEENIKYQYFRFEFSSDISSRSAVAELRFYGIAYTEHEPRDATCTQIGYKREFWQRSTDGKYFSDSYGVNELNASDVEIPMLPHEIVHYDASDANIEYWQCSMCGKCFRDAEGNTEIPKEDTKIYQTISIDGSIARLVSSNVGKAVAGSTVTLTVSHLIDADSLKANNGSVALTKAGNGKYTFTVPAESVTITAKKLKTYSVTLPEHMEIVSASYGADAEGRYISGTQVSFRAVFYATATNVKNGADTLTAANGIFSVTVGTADITVTADIEYLKNINLLNADRDFTIMNSTILTGKTNHTVTIADGAEITLNNATINGGIVCEGTAVINLVEANSVKGIGYRAGEDYYTAGIQVGGAGTTLTIRGNGSLQAKGGLQAAGIGLGAAFGHDAIGGDIVIEGGNIIASGGEFTGDSDDTFGMEVWGAGIGTGSTDYGLTSLLGNITIKGGAVTANGGARAYGIGSGETYPDDINKIGTVTIYDDVAYVNATSIVNDGSIVYMHGETDVTADANAYFNIEKDGGRSIIEPKEKKYFAITIADGIEHGTISYAATARYGENITIEAKPDYGFRLRRLIVKDTNNNEILSTGNTFEMPNRDVTVNAVFEAFSHGTTAFQVCTYNMYWDEDLSQATIYDGITTVFLSSYHGGDYDEGYYIVNRREDYFALDSGEGIISIPYTGGLGSFVSDKTYICCNSGFYDFTLEEVSEGKWFVSALKTVPVIGDIPDQIYTGSEIKPEPWVMAGTLNLAKDNDYSYSYTNNEDAGIAKVIVTFKGKYSALGKVEKEFKIQNPITVDMNILHGTVNADKELAVKGETVTLTATPDEDYILSKLIVTDLAGNEITVEDDHFTMPADSVSVTAVFIPDPAHFQTFNENTYVIRDEAGWNLFCDCLQDNETYNRFSGKNVWLAKNISVTRMAGSDKHDFCGTFDGFGNTLTFTESNYVNGVAPFRYISETTPVGGSEVSHPAIRNLKVVCDIESTADFASGLVGRAWGTLTIENCTVSGTINTEGKFACGFLGEVNCTAFITNCVSSVTIISHTEGDGTHAGFVGCTRQKYTPHIEGCVFNGKMLTTNGTNRCAGFVGWNSGDSVDTVIIRNSIYAPSALADDETSVSAEESASFCRNGGTFTNCYYTSDFNDGTKFTEQGKQARTIAAGSDVTIDYGAAENTYNVSGITAYATGIEYNGKFYAGDGDNIALTLSHADRDGYTFIGYKASAGTLSGETLTMPDSDVTVSAEYGFTDSIGAHLYGHSLSLEGDIGVNFYMDLSPDILASSTAKMVFTVPNAAEPQEVLVSDVLGDKKIIEGHDYYPFKCRVSSKEMTSEITAQIVDGENKSAEYEYCVKDYADYILEHASSYSDEIIALVKAMLNYGAYSQAYFGYNRDKLANTTLTDDEKTAINTITAETVARPYNSTTEKLPENVVFAKVNLVLESETVLNLFFTNDSGKELIFSQPAFGTLTQNQTNDGYSKVSINTITAADLDKDIIVSFRLAEDDTEYSIHYSPMNYCYNVLNREEDAVRTPALKNVMRALYLYNKTAKEYFNKGVD